MLAKEAHDNLLKSAKIEYKWYGSHPSQLEGKELGIRAVRECNDEWNYYYGQGSPSEGSSASEGISGKGSS